MIRALAVSILFATSLAAQPAFFPDIRLGAERPVGEATLGAWPSSAQSLVAEGSGYVAFWLAPVSAGFSDLMASHITSDGTPVFHAKVLALRPAAVMAAARVGSGFNQYLVAYTGSDGTFLLSVNAGFAVRSIRRIGEPANDVDLECNGGGCAVAWLDSASRIRAELTTLDGTTVAGPILIGDNAMSLSLASAQNTFLASFSRASTGTGLVLFNNSGSIERTLGRPEDECAASGTGRRYLIACADLRNINTLTISEIAPDTPARTIVTSRSDRTISTLSVAATQTNGLVAFALVEPAILITGAVAPQSLFGVRVDEDGDVLESLAFDIAGQPVVNWIADTATNGRDFLVAWNHSPSTIPTDITAHVTAISAAGTIIRQAPLRVGPQHQIGDTVARSATGSLAVWRELSTLAGTFTLRAARLDGDETALDRIELAANQNSFNPAAASDGRDYMVVWSEIRGNTSIVRSAAISAIDGHVTSGLLIPGFGLPAITWTGGSYATVLWRSGLKLLRLAPDGSHAGEFDVAPLTSVPNWAAIASTANRILVVWSADGGTFYALFDSDGIMLVSPTQLNTRSAAPVAAAGMNDEFVIFSGTTPTVASRISLSGRAFGPDTVVDSRSGSRVIGVSPTPQGFFVATAAFDNVTRGGFFSQGFISQPVTLTGAEARLISISRFDESGQASLLFVRRNEDNVQSAVVRELSTGAFLRRRAVR